MKYLFLHLFFCSSLFVQAQDKAIGSWASHFSHNIAKSIAFDGKDKVYCADLDLFSYSISTGEYETLTKVNGLSDVGIRLIRYSPTANYLLIAYDNSNIDLLVDKNIINIPDIKNLQISGSKRINGIFFYNKLAYLSTDFGVVVLDPEKKEIKETYILQVGNTIAKINGFTHFQSTFLAATDLGLFAADENTAVLQDFSNWTIIDFTIYTQLIGLAPNNLFLATDKELFRTTHIDSVPKLRYTSPVSITRLNEGDDKLFLSENGANRSAILLFDQDGMRTDSLLGLFSNDVAQVNDEVYFADGYNGLTRNSFINERILLNPGGPYSNSSFNLNISNNLLLVSGGAHADWKYTFSSNGFSTYDFMDWKVYNRFINIPAMDSVYDILNVIVDPKTNNFFAASFGGGLLEIKKDLSTTVYKDNGFINSAIGDPGSNRIVDMTFDDNQNLWLSNYGSQKPLVVKKADGTWQNFDLPTGTGGNENPVSQIVIDNADQKWIVAPRGVGVYVYNNNNTIDQTGDDLSRWLTTGIGRGNLPNSNVNCLAKDKDGAIWVGTFDGIGIFNCAESVLTTNGCDAELKIVQYDENAGLLFQSENVKTIAVDGANNKWIGTNNGVWQISDDGETILQQFNLNNSPLPSNEINKIVVHPTTGDVFIATTKGLVSYRGQATEGNSTSNNIIVFPNPVPPSYGGTIAIKGLTENADVRITDVSGQLVFRTKAQGGQATWNGKNYLGNRPMTGIYYVFVTNSDGNQTKTTKFIFNE